MVNNGRGSRTPGNSTSMYCTIPHYRGRITYPYKKAQIKELVRMAKRVMGKKGLEKVLVRISGTM